MKAPGDATMDLAGRVMERESRRVAAASGHPAVVATFHEVFEKLNQDLAGLVGPVGVHALQARALRLASLEHPVLARVDVERAGQSRVRGLPTAVEGEEEEELRVALTAVVAHLIDLLKSLVGDDLTFRLLARVWPEAGLTDPRTYTQEEAR